LRPVESSGILTVRFGEGSCDMETRVLLLALGLHTEAVAVLLPILSRQEQAFGPNATAWAPIYPLAGLRR
jgi:hypothetical protein